MSSDVILVQSQPHLSSSCLINTLFQEAQQDYKLSARNYTTYNSVLILIRSNCDLFIIILHFRFRILDEKASLTKLINPVLVVDLAVVLK